MKLLRWIVLGAIGGFGCGGGGEEPGSLARAEVVEASGRFGPTTGELDLVVVPTDAEGRFVGDRLFADRIFFDSVRIGSAEPGGPRLSVRTRADGIELDTDGERVLVRGLAFYGAEALDTVPRDEVNGYLSITEHASANPVRTNFTFAPEIVE